MKHVTKELNTQVLYTSSFHEQNIGIGRIV